MKNKDVIKQILILALCEFVGVALMLLAFFALGKFSVKVLLGGIIGGLACVAYFFMLSVSIANIVDSAAAEKSSKAASYRAGAGSSLRLLAVGVVLAICIKAGISDPVATIVPLLFLRPSLTIIGFFSK